MKIAGEFDNSPLNKADGKPSVFLIVKTEIPVTVAGMFPYPAFAHSGHILYGSSAPADRTGGFRISLFLSNSGSLDPAAILTI